ncbi:MAG: hypothetical protein M1330_03080 [Armatimonadetes bacterium]|nr:hypothetical protein [Armatimonadota bacterium]
MNGSGLKFKEMMGLVGPERSEAKRSEADRSAGSTKPATMQVAAPDPKVSEKRGRRRFTTTYKARIVRCPHCRNGRLQASAKYPHCGNP